MSDTPTPTSPADAPKPRTPRWVKIAFGLSLALNLAVIGIIAGAAMRFSQHADASPPRGGFILIAAMERDDRKAILSDFRQVQRATRKAGHVATRDLLETLRADTFDRARAERLVGATRNATNEVQQQMQARWLETVANMSVEKRAAYADRLEEKMNRRGPGRKTRKD